MHDDQEESRCDDVTKRDLVYLKPYDDATKCSVNERALRSLGLKLAEEVKEGAHCVEHVITKTLFRLKVVLDALQKTSWRWR
jgi:hypothetical protein